MKNSIQIKKANGTTLKIKQIVGYPDYSITNEGDVISFKGKIKILEPLKKLQGYLTVKLRNENGVKEFYIHRLVVTAFSKFTKTKKIVNHLDGDKKNNNESNLVASTYSENRIHGLLGKKITINKSKILIINIKNGKILKVDSKKEAAIKLNVSPSAIYNCLNNLQKTIKNYTIEYDVAA